MAAREMFIDAEYNAQEEKDNNIIGSRIAEARKSKGLSLAAFCEALEECGVSVGIGAVSKWERGVSVPSAYQLLAVCRVLNIGSGLEYFCEKLSLNPEGQRLLGDYRELLISSGKYRPRAVSHLSYRDMPVSCLPASAGTGSFLDSGNFEMVSFPETAIAAGAEFGIRVSGDSMEPVYHDGQIVWVKECRELRLGEVGIFVYEGSGYIKIYDEQEPEDKEEYTDVYGVVHMQPVMVSCNKNYPDKPVMPDSEFRIIGRVL